MDDDFTEVASSMSDSTANTSISITPNFKERYIPYPTSIQWEWKCGDSQVTESTPKEPIKSRDLDEKMMGHLLCILNKNVESDFLQILTEKNTSLQRVPTDFTAILIRSDDVLSNDIMKWKADICGVIKKYCQENFIVQSENIGEDKYNFVMDKLYKYAYQAKWGISLYFEKEKDVFVVGNKEDVAKFHEEILKPILESSIMEQKMSMDDTLKTILEVTKFRRRVEKLAPGLIFRYDDAIFLKGMPEDVRTIRLEIIKMKNEWTLFKFELSHAKTVILSKKKGLSFYRRQMKGKWDWSLDDRNLTVMMRKGLNNKQGEKDIVGFLQEEDIELNDYEASTLFKSEKWKHFQRLLSSNYKDKYHLSMSNDEQRLIIAGTCDIFQNLKEKIHNFRDRNVIKQTTLKCSPDTRRAIAFVNSNYLHEIERESKTNFVKISETDAGYTCSGTQEGIDIVQANLDVLSVKVRTKTFGIGSERVTNYLKSAEGRKTLEETGAQCECLFAVKNVTGISLEFGNITDQNTDVIVNSVGRNLYLNVGNPYSVCQAVFEKGGNKFQEKLLSENPDGIRPGEVVIAGKEHLLKCVEVYNVYLESSTNNETVYKTVNTLVTKCLVTARDRQRTCIAIPALGTGTLSYPPKLAAKATYDAILNFSKGNADCYVKEIKVVILQAATEAVKEAFTSENSTRRVSDSFVELNHGCIQSGALVVTSQSEEKESLAMECLRNRIPKPDVVIENE